MMLFDSHVHLGRTEGGKPIKIGAGSSLTLRRVLAEMPVYGVDLAAVVDLATARGLHELEDLLAHGGLQEDEDGAFRAPGGQRILGALEVELRAPPAGPYHLLAYAQGLDGLRQLAGVYRDGVSNADLSTQRLHLEPDAFRRAVEEAGGRLVVAHAFTPHRGLFGVGLRLEDVFSDPKGLGLELGLSADVEIARGVGAIGELGLLGGSDAHGPLTIGRELNALAVDTAGFSALRKLLDGGAAAIFGMHPAFGKYHRTYCLRCGAVALGEPPQLRCSRDPSHPVVVGVLDRARSMAPPDRPRRYPAYRYQLPLGLLPGFGAATRGTMAAEFGSIHRALHEVADGELRRVLGKGRAEAIVRMRQGASPDAPGGGGHWGRAAPGAH